MNIISATEARANIFRLMDAVSANHEPITITGKRGNAVLMSEEDWRAIQETLYLSSIPNMAESIIQAAQERVEDCVGMDDLEW